MWLLVKYSLPGVM